MQVTEAEDCEFKACLNLQSKTLLFKKIKIAHSFIILINYVCVHTLHVEDREQLVGIPFLFLPSGQGLNSDC